QAAQCRKGLFVVAVDDQASDVVLLVGDDRFGEEGLERQVGESEARRHPLLSAARGHAGQDIAPAQRPRPGKHGLQVGEAVDGSVYCGGVSHFLYRTATFPISWTSSLSVFKQISLKALVRASRSRPGARTLMSSCAFSARATSATTSAVRP